MRDNGIYVLNGGADWDAKKELIMTSGPANVKSFVGGLPMPVPV